MTLAQVINRLFCLRGGNRVEVVWVDSVRDNFTFRDIGTGRVYNVEMRPNKSWFVIEQEGDDCWSASKFSKYFEGLLAGKTRNDAGELV